MTTSNRNEQIEATLERLGAAWRAAPELRLGQLLVNVIRPKEACSEIFLAHDATVIAGLRDMVPADWAPMRFITADDALATEPAELQADVKADVARYQAEKALELADRVARKLQSKLADVFDAMPAEERGRALAEITIAILAQAADEAGRDRPHYKLDELLAQCDPEAPMPDVAQAQDGEPTGVLRYLDCSTAHIADATHAVLNAAVGNYASLSLMVAGYKYGWFINVPPDADYGSSVPADLRTVLDYARTVGAVVVRLDADGYTHAALPIAADCAVVGPSYDAAPATPGAVVPRRLWVEDRPPPDDTWTVIADTGRAIEQLQAGGWDELRVGRQFYGVLTWLLTQADRGDMACIPAIVKRNNARPDVQDGQVYHIPHRVDFEPLWYMEPTADYETAVFTGTNVPVHDLFEHLAAGLPMLWWCLDHPDVTEAQCEAALVRAGELLAERAC